MSSFYKRVLSVQSHVVSGCVGNRAAVFGLQLLGFDVDFINSVHFSNHTGYKTIKGSVMTGDQLRDIAIGLKSNNLIDYDYLLTGYIGSQTFLDSVLELLSSIKECKPDVKYVCDPVLGDDGKCYVPHELIKTFIDTVIPQAYMITPNQYEAELLTSSKIISNDDAIRSMVQLYKMGPQIVVLTSAEVNDYPGKLSCYILYYDDSNIDSNSSSTEKEVTIIQYVIDKQEGHYTGTGDATAALLLAWTSILGKGNYGLALKNVLGTIQAVIARTRVRHESIMKEFDRTTDDSNRVCRASELCIVQSKADIENPPVLITIVDKKIKIKI